MKLTRSSDPWYVIATAPNAEEKAARKLTEAGFHVYLPRYCVEIHNKRTRTWRKSYRPLLPPYMFIVLRKFEFETVREKGGVQFVRGIDGPKMVNGEAVEQLQIMEMDNIFDQVRGKTTAKRDRLAKEFTPGSEVQIKVGQWAEFMAVVKEVTDRAKVKVGFQLFGREMDAEIEAEHLSAA